MNCHLLVQCDSHIYCTFLEEDCMAELYMEIQFLRVLRLLKHTVSSTEPLYFLMEHITLSI